MGDDVGGIFAPPRPRRVLLSERCEFRISELSRRRPRIGDDMPDDMPDITIRSSHVMRGRELILNVRLLHDWRFRLGLWLIKLGGRIMGLAIKHQERGTDA